MANNLIQIKRSATTATPGSLQAGELAFSNVTGGSGVLFIGSTDGGTVVPIGGVRNPGTLTANQALVANSTSYLDVIKTANLYIGSATVNAINSVANLTHLGAAGNNELSTTWAIKTYVDAKAAAAANPQGSNGEFQYNNSGSLAGTNNMVYDNTTGQITIGNTTVNVQIGYTGSINALAHFHGQQNSYVQVIMQNSNSGTRASSDFVAENDLGSETENYVDLGINSSTYNDPAFSAMAAGDAYLYTANNDLVIGAADTTGEVKFITGGTTTSEIRATITAGGNVGIGNTTPNAKLQVTGTANVSGATTLGSTLTVNGVTTLNANLTLTTPLIANGGSGSSGQILLSNGATGAPYWGAAPTTVAGSDTQIQYNDGGSLAGAAGLTFSKSTNNVTVANSLIVTATANAAAFTVGALFVANTTQVTLNGIGLNANGSLGAQGQALFSNGATGSPFWGTAVRAITAANGLVGSGTSTVQLDVGQGNGISVTADAVAVSLIANSGLGANTTGLYVNTAANSGLAINSTGVYIASGNGLATNSTFLSVRAGDSTIVSNATGVYVNPVLSITDLTLSGNLIVSGTVTSVNTTTLLVKDNVVGFASNNTTTDVVDSGFFSPAGNSINTWYSGLARIAAKSTSDNPYFWLFNSNTNPNTATTISAGGTGTLEAYLQPYGNTSSVFVVNSTAIQINANSTVAATLSINSVSLTTALAATSGGTGQSSYATGDLLYATSSTALGRLAVPGSAANGQVLQITNNLPAYGTLDGGTF